MGEKSRGALNARSQVICATCPFCGCLGPRCRQLAQRGISPVAQATRSTGTGGTERSPLLTQKLQGSSGTNYCAFRMRRHEHNVWVYTHTYTYTHTHGRTHSQIRTSTPPPLISFSLSLFLSLSLSHTYTHTLTKLHIYTYKKIEFFRLLTMQDTTHLIHR